jgi:hypothetical protein
MSMIVSRSPSSWTLNRPASQKDDRRLILSVILTSIPLSVEQIPMASVRVKFANGSAPSRPA